MDGQSAYQYQSHDRIADELEYVYIESINSAVMAAAYLHRPVGPIWQYYEPFQSNFRKLYLHTCNISEVASRMDPSGNTNYSFLRNAIESWLENDVFNRKNLKSGVKLHKDYLAVLRAGGVFTLKRSR
jgi:hypothetical protein